MSTCTKSMFAALTQDRSLGFRVEGLGSSVYMEFGVAKLHEPEP